MRFPIFAYIYIFQQTVLCQIRFYERRVAQNRQINNPNPIRFPQDFFDKNKLNLFTGGNLYTERVLDVPETITTS